MNEKTETGLFCIDVDNTIIDGHTHNIIWSAIYLARLIKDYGKWNVIKPLIEDEIATEQVSLHDINIWEELFEVLMENNKWKDIESNDDIQWELVKNIPPVGGDAKAWKDLFLTLQNAGHSIALVSFSAYGTIFPRYLHEIIGLDRDFIDHHICIVSRPTKDQSTKKGHITEAQAKTRRLNLFPEKIVFCDDDGDLLKDAKDINYQVVHANADGDHIEELLEKSESIKIPSKRWVENSPTLLRQDSPVRARANKMRRIGSGECSSENSNDYNPLKSSLEGMKIN